MCIALPESCKLTLMIIVGCREVPQDCARALFHRSCLGSNPGGLVHASANKNLSPVGINIGDTGLRTQRKQKRSRIQSITLGSRLATAGAPFAVCRKVAIT